MLYVNQLDKSNQRIIENEIIKRLKELGYQGKELEQLLNDALCSKVVDLDIEKENENGKIYNDY